MPPFAKRSLGQNFLIDPNIIRKIATAINAKPGEKILEIGPGRGALTKLLVDSGVELTAIELDSSLAEILRANYSMQKSFHLIEGDALKLSWNKLLPLSKIVGNLPYNIASQLVLKLFENHRQVKRAVFMVQKEFAQRLFAEAGSKTYGIMSIYRQLYSGGKVLFFISPEVFRPRPKVDSALIELIPYENLLLPDEERLLFHSLVRVAFNQRRKTLRVSLKRWYSSQLAEKFAWGKRPESLSLDDFIRLFEILKEKIASDRGLNPGALPQNNLS